jgi:hypothetical protein
MPVFNRYIGIDYSGAERPATPLRGLQVFVADRRREPSQENNPTHPTGRWSRQQLALWLLDRLVEDVPTIVGIDHAFSYPLSILEGAALQSWDDFLGWFETRCPTTQDRVSECIPGNLEFLKRHQDELRLTDRWTATAMPLCSGWEGNRSNVFFSTHAGIPWLKWLRNRGAGRIHFWPFDGFTVPQGKSVIAEVYPRIFRRRYHTDLTGDARDAWLVCQWLRDRNQKNCLAPYFEPPVDEAEQRQARIEGWILGVA